MTGSGEVPVSVVVITRNESRNLPACLASVPFASQLVVVDAGSTDGTQELARAAGAEVVEREWDGYASQRQAGFARASCEWVLWLDADERVTPDLAQEIERVVAAPGPLDGYLIPRRHYFLGDWLRHGGEYPAHQLRLIRRGRAVMRPDLVHETIDADGLALGTLASPIDHFSSPNLSTRLAKARLYAGLAAEQAVLGDDRRPYGPAAVLSRPARRFAHLFFRLQAYRDGWRGWLWALVAAYEQFLIVRGVRRRAQPRREVAR